jgi:hypothetical protein
LKRTGVDETSYQQRWSACFDVIADILNARPLQISWKRMNQHTFVVSTIMLGFVSPMAYASDEVGHHEYPHHHLALFAGGGFERDDHGHEEDGAALGLEYEVQWHEKWGVGADFERLFGSGQHRSWVAVIPLSFHVTESWRLFAGPGLEFAGKEDKYLMRVGIAYEIPFHQRWTASPEILVDFIEGGAKTYVIGVAVGYGF